MKQIKKIEKTCSPMDDYTDFINFHLVDIPSHFNSQEIIDYFYMGFDQQIKDGMATFVFKFIITVED